MPDVNGPVPPLGRRVTIVDVARHVVDVVEGLDLSALERAYAGKGSDAYHPATLLSLLIYGYATGPFSNRKIERATYDSLTFRYAYPHRWSERNTGTPWPRRPVLITVSSGHRSRKRASP